MWARTKFMAAISVTEALSLAIFLKGKTTTLYGPCLRDQFKSALALMRSRSHLGSGDGSLSSSRGSGSIGDGGGDSDPGGFCLGDDILSVAPVMTESSLDISDDESMTGWLCCVLCCMESI